MMHRLLSHLLVLVALVQASACSAAGALAPPAAPVASSLSFPIRSAFSARAANGSKETLHATGTGDPRSAEGSCAGTMLQTASPATTAATFEGHAAWSSAETGNLSFTNCDFGPIATAETVYYDSSYALLGSSTPRSYGVYLADPRIPVSAKVGDSGPWGKLSVYKDSTKQVSTSHHDKSYVVEPDTATTAIVSIITKGYDAKGEPSFTSQVRYRITASGGLTLISDDTLYLPSTRLVFR